MQKKSVQHSTSQWTPKTIEVRLHLNLKCMDKQNILYSALNNNEGVVISSSSLFTLVNQHHNCFCIEINLKSIVWLEEVISRDTRNKRPILLYVTSSLREASAACSKLNMALALSCQILAKLDGTDVIFCITSPNKNVEESLLKHFDIFEGN